jgi:hypothetical protein
VEFLATRLYDKKKGGNVFNQKEDANVLKTEGFLIG